jgi:8-oxo-dGTP diphosphatase
MKPGIDYIGVGTGAFIVNKEGKLLLTRRGPNARNQVGKWEAPGGKIEFGETSKETIVREAKEELDIDIQIDALLGFIDDIIFEEKQHRVGPTWLASIVAGEPKIMEPDMCDGMGWFTVEEADQLEKSQTLRHDLEVYKNYLLSK